MNKAVGKIQVFEHNTLYHGKEYKGVLFKEQHFNLLAKLNQFHDNKYFTLVHKGIKFSQYVGVIQVDGLCIEILPKIDNSEEDTQLWQGVLISMLKATKRLKVNNIGHANVNKQNIHLLDIYFEWFLNEVQNLIHQGLIKKYYKETGNVKALKGKLDFAQHLNANLIHKERFFTTHQIYNKDHLVHQILGVALEIISQFSRGTYIYGKCKTVQLDFPEVTSIQVNQATFTKLPKSRKTKPYETALEIARLIILNFAPNISSGSEKMLALLFDMNSLWEEYVLVRLRQAAAEGVIVYGQNYKPFWNNITIRPDIVITKGDDTFVIDTKWKNINGSKPSTNDLRQMYVYNEYWKSNNSILLYPAPETKSPNFISYDGDDMHQCAIGKLNILNHTGLNENVGYEILEWFERSVN